MDKETPAQTESGNSDNRVVFSLDMASADSVRHPMKAPLWKRPASRALWWAWTSPLVLMTSILGIYLSEGIFFCGGTAIDNFLTLAWLTLGVLAGWLAINRARALDLGWGTFHCWTMLSTAAWLSIVLLCDDMGYRSDLVYYLQLGAGVPIGIAFLILETACAFLPPRRR